MLEEFVSFFMICHTLPPPPCEQCKHEVLEGWEPKEVIWEKDAANKKDDATQHKASSTLDNNQIKRGQLDNHCSYCKTEGYDNLWSSCKCHNWNHPNYCKPIGSFTQRPWDQAPQDGKDNCDRGKHCCEAAITIVMTEEIAATIMLTTLDAIVFIPILVLFPVLLNHIVRLMMDIT